MLGIICTPCPLPVVDSAIVSSPVFTVHIIFTRLKLVRASSSLSLLADWREKPVLALDIVQWCAVTSKRKVSRGLVLAVCSRLYCHNLNKFVLFVVCAESCD